MQRTPTSSTQFKLAVSSRVKGKDVLRDVHTAKQVQEAMTEEIRLWHLHFGESPGAAQPAHAADGPVGRHPRLGHTAP